MRMMVRNHPRAISALAKQVSISHILKVVTYHNRVMLMLTWRNQFHLRIKGIRETTNIIN